MAARRGRRRATAEGEAGAAADASSSSSAAAPEPATTTFASGGLQPVVAVDKLADFIEETHARDSSIAWEKSVHQLQIAGVTVTVTGSLYAILSYVNTYITTANITALVSALASAFGTYASVISAWLTANPHVIILLLLASVLGATIEPITVAIAMGSTRDPAIRASRVEAVKAATELMRKPGTAAYAAVGTLLTNVGANAAASAARSAAGSAANAIANHVRTATESAVTAMASMVDAGVAAGADAARDAAKRAKEFIVGTPDLVKRRGDILRLRRAIYIYTEAMKAMNVADEFTEDVLKLRENAHYLLGQIVTYLGKLNADGITDEKIESYVGKGLPGLTGMAVEIGLFADAVRKGFKPVGSSVIDTVRENFKGVMRRVFHGDIAGKLATEPENPLTEPALEVDSMIQTFKGLGVEPPPPQPKFSPEKGYMVTHKRYTINLKRIATETGIPYPTPKKPKHIRGKSQKLSDVEIAERLKSQIESIIRKKPRAMAESSTELEEIQTLERNLQKLNTFINISKEGSSAPGSVGRHTVRKHKKRHSKKSVRRHRRKKTVSHRRGKRAHNRRRTNRRTTKRSKK